MQQDILGGKLSLTKEQEQYRSNAHLKSDLYMASKGKLLEEDHSKVFI